MRQEERGTAAVATEAAMAAVRVVEVRVVAVTEAVKAVAERVAAKAALRLPHQRSSVLRASLSSHRIDSLQHTRHLQPRASLV